MAHKIREVVSKKKRRYQRDGFDLDLTYVTPRIIAMGFPSENMEAAFRNPMKEVLRFLDSFHKDHYKVYNLCAERSYEPEKFYNRVEVFPFEDHNAPPFNLIQQFCLNVSQWLDQDEKNIAVIHCKAGKGRTGLMIAAWMIYSKEWATANDALTFYAAMRTYNKKGVTIPSQIRYVHYFEESLSNPPKPKTLFLNRLVFHTLPKVAHINDINFQVYKNKACVFIYKEHEDKTGNKKEKKKKTKKDSEDEEEEESFSFDCRNTPLCDDVKMEFFEKGSKLFTFWFCVSFVKGNRLVLRKDELDKANKDTSHKNYHPQFRVELIFDDLAKDVSEISLNSQEQVINTINGSSAGDSSSATTSTSAPPSPSDHDLLMKVAEEHDQYPTV